MKRTITYIVITLEFKNHWKIYALRIEYFSVCRHREI